MSPSACDQNGRLARAAFSPCRDRFTIRWLSPASRAIRPRLSGELLAGDIIRYAEHFEDGVKLLQAAADMRLEGIVSKRRMAAYIAGSRCGWLKVKTAEWGEANRERYKLFEKIRGP